MYKVKVDRNECTGCGVCYNLDPNHFEADWGNKSAVITGKGDIISVGSFEDDLMENVKNAIKSCPVSAIQIIDSYSVIMKN
jgi:ferredoxin